MQIHPGKGVFKKERSFQTPGNTLTSKSVVSLGTSEGNITWRKNKYLKPTDYMSKTTFSGEAAQTLMFSTSMRRLGMEAGASLLRVRTGPECPKGNLRGLT